MSLLKIKGLNNGTLVFHNKAIIGYEVSNVNNHNCDGIDCPVHSILNYLLVVRFVDDGNVPLCFKDETATENFIEALEKLLLDKKEYVLIINLTFKEFKKRTENREDRFNIVESFTIEEA